MQQHILCIQYNHEYINSVNVMCCVCILSVVRCWTLVVSPFCGVIHILLTTPSSQLWRHYYWCKYDTHSSINAKSNVHNMQDLLYKMTGSLALQFTINLYASVLCQLPNDCSYSGVMTCIVHTAWMHIICTGLDDETFIADKRKQYWLFDNGHP